MQRRNVILAFLIFSFALLVYIYLPVLDAIAYGVFLAYLSRPIAYKAGEIIGVPLATFFTLVVLLLAGFTMFVYVGTEIFVELSNISATLNVEPIGETGGLLSKWISEHPEVHPVLESFSSSINKYFEILSGYLLSFFIGLVNLAVTSILAFVVAFFLLKDGKKLRLVIEGLVPRELRRSIEIIDHNLEGIFLGSVFSAIVVGLITYAAFSFFNLPYAFLVSISSAVLQFVPMVGPQIILIPGMLIAALLGRYVDAMVLFGLSVFLFFVPDNIIKPLILTKTTKVNPMLVLLSFIGGVLALGPKGFVIGPIFLAVCDGLVRVWLKLE